LYTVSPKQREWRRLKYKMIQEGKAMKIKKEM